MLFKLRLDDLRVVLCTLFLFLYSPLCSRGLSMGTEEYFLSDVNHLRLHYSLKIK